MRVHKKIPNFFEPQYRYDYLYFHSGLYCEQVKGYIDLFGDNVLVVSFDSFRNSPPETYRSICLFLGIKPNPLPPTIFNVSRSVYSPKLQFLLRKINNVLILFRSRVFFEKNIDKKKRDRLLNLGINETRPAKMKGETREVLIKKYEEDIRCLSALTGIDFSGWLKV